MGSQLAVAGGKLMPGNTELEGAKPRRKVYVKYVHYVWIVLYSFVFVFVFVFVFNVIEF